MAKPQSPALHSYANSVAALLIADGAAEDALTALRYAGIRLQSQIDFAEAAAHLHDSSCRMILIEAADAPTDMLEPLLIRAEAIAREQLATIVVAITPDQIDAVTANLLGGNYHLLCEPSIAERLAALALAGAAMERRDIATLHDAARDAEYGRLQRLNEEVARIADTLARLTRGEEDERRGAGVRDAASQYRGPAEEITAEASAHEIRAVIRSRRLRAQFFDGELFADPAWDMLLDLFAAGLERRKVSVSSLCIAAAVPPTTALRWIATLHDAGLFERQADPSDRRRAYIGLSAKGLAGLRSYVSAAKRAGLGLV